MFRPTSPQSQAGWTLTKNAIFNLLGQAAPLLVSFLTIPIIVRELGSERFGILSLVWVAITYLTIFDFGLGRATTRFVASAIGKADEDVDRYIGTATVAQGVLGGLAMLGLGAATPWLVHDVLKVPNLLQSEAKVVLYLLAAAAPVLLVSITYRGALEAAQRFDLINVVRGPVAIASSVLSVAAVLLGWGLPGIVALSLITNVVAALIYRRLCRHIFPSLRVARRFERPVLTKMFSYGGWITISDAVGPLLTYLDRFLLASLVSLAAVAYYAGPYEVILRLSIVSTSIVGALFPAFAALSHPDARDDLKRLFSHSLKYMFLAVGGLAVLVAVNANDILNIFLGPEYAERSTSVVQILALGVVINAISQLPYALLHAQGRPDLTAKFHVLELPLYVAVLFVVVPAWGAAGAAAAWTLRVAVDAVLLFAAAHVLTPFRINELFMEEMRHAAKLLGIFALTTVLVTVLIGSLWIRVPVLTLAAALVGLAGKALPLGKRSGGVDPAELLAG